MALLDISDLSVRIGNTQILKRISLSVAPGEILGLVGESGSGKSMTLLSAMRLLPSNADTTGTVTLDSEDLTAKSERDMCNVRGARMGMIFQEPMTALNPVQTIGHQVAEMFTLHRGLSTREAMTAASAHLTKVGLPPDRVPHDRYPHELSGGQRQRVVIAIATALSPPVLLADEPTTALDVTIQGQILFEVQKLCRDFGTSLIWITHDLSVVAGLADDICVMYAGKVVEAGQVDPVLDHPLHPYTHGLLGSVPSRNERGRPLQQIPGMTPSLLNLEPGCAFRTRCPRADQACLVEPDQTSPLPGRTIRCFHPHLEIERAA